jgi:cytochrome c oxidase cbb3-type subunit I/II
MTHRSIQVSYNNEIPKLFLWAAMIFGIVGMLVGVWAALELAYWPANGSYSFLSFGRIRPVHTNAMVFAFAGNAFFSGLYYSLERLLYTPMWSRRLSYIHFWGWQIIILITAVTIPLGLTQGKEYAEMEWWIDILIALVWVLMTLNVFMTIAIRKVEHLYVSVWFYVASIITVALLHVVNALALPLNLSKSYPIFSGVQDALVQWWYGHNAVGFLLTTPFLGLMYYFLPKAAGKPVYSYRLSVIHFWSLVFIYIWAGPHHLLYTALPDWAQTLGMIFSLMLIAPSWGGMLNGLLTLRTSWKDIQENPVLQFFVLALTFYGMATLEGPLMSIKSFNLLTHYTDYTIAHVHGGALGWLGGMVFAIFYYMAPKIWNRPLYSLKMAQTHFWLTMVGIALYVVSMWVAGLTQGVMWFSETPEGRLLYPQFMETVLALKPLYWTRTLGGLIYLVGTVLGLYNLIQTARHSQGALDTETVTLVLEDEKIEPSTWHEKLEHKGFQLTALAFVCVLIGGVVEFLPSFLIDKKTAQTQGTTPYTPLELAGRDIYIREGCHTCHSQMVRTYGPEVKRYGPHSKAHEFIYDFPFQWGSKRTGPDLHRVGGKYNHTWHYNHMKDPRSTSPGSIMPAYPWLYEADLDWKLLPKKIQLMTTLGVPYDFKSEDEIIDGAQAAARAIAQDLNIGDFNKEILPLIAYLQRLGKEPPR